jgi:Uma2 family endonuclease
MELLMSVQLLKRQFSVKEYNQMPEAGILEENERVELIRGEIVEMSPIGTRHAAYVRRLNTLFSERLRGRAIVDIQNPVELDDTSEPQPDVALLQPRADFYILGHPQPRDILLIIEVADTTVRYDREVKIPLYAEDEIVEVWLVDINGQLLQVYREPTPDGYQNVRELRRGASLSILAFPDVTIAVNEILG